MAARGKGFTQGARRASLSQIGTGGARMARYKRRRPARSKVVPLADTLRGGEVTPPPGARSQRSWHVVVMTDAGRRRLYTVMTQDVGYAVHRATSPVGGGYAYEHGIGRLVLVEAYGCRHTAYARMMRIRGWPVAARAALVSEANPDWDDLSAAYLPDAATEREQPTGPKGRSAAA